MSMLRPSPSDFMDWPVKVVSASTAGATSFFLPSKHHAKAPIFRTPSPGLSLPISTLSMTDFRELRLPKHEISCIGFFESIEVKMANQYSLPYGIRFYCL